MRAPAQTPIHFRPFILIGITRLAGRLLCLCLALMLLAWLIGHSYPRLTVIYNYGGKLRLVDLGRGFELELRGDYQTGLDLYNRTTIVSPDGKSIAVSDSNARVTRYSPATLLLDLTGGSIRSFALPYAQPVWSPDSRYIATSPLHVADGADQWMEIHVVDTRTAKVRQLTPAHRYVRIWDIAWSADSQWLIFVAQKTAQPVFTFYTVKRDGSDFRQLDCISADDGNVANRFAFAPGGERVAFPGGPDNSVPIVVMNLKDCERRPLTDGDSTNGDPLWSPDGTHLAILSHKDGQLEVYVMDADGGHPQRVTNDLRDETLLSWSPDGQYLLYYSVPPLKGGVITLYYADLRANMVHSFDLLHRQFQSFPAWAM
jgi:Tol biopolymer transport system component